MRLTLGVLCLVASSTNITAETLRVIGIASNDVLNVRELPSTQARIVGIVPPNARSVTFDGEARGAWVFVRYRNIEGWADRRYLMPEVPPVRRGRVLGSED